MLLASFTEYNSTWSNPLLPGGAFYGLAQLQTAIYGPGGSANFYEGRDAANFARFPEILRQAGFRDASLLPPYLKKAASSTTFRPAVPLN
jgi:hypothetical protein